MVQSNHSVPSWALPIAGPNVAPNHVPEREYYAVPVDNLRTYPVYDPDHEPKGYQEHFPGWDGGMEAVTDSWPGRRCLVSPAVLSPLQDTKLPDVRAAGTLANWLRNQARRLYDYAEPTLF